MMISPLMIFNVLRINMMTTTRTATTVMTLRMMVATMTMMTMMTMMMTTMMIMITITMVMTIPIMMMVTITTMLMMTSAPPTPDISVAEGLFSRAVTPAHFLILQTDICHYPTTTSTAVTPAHLSYYWNTTATRIYYLNTYRISLGTFFYILSDLESIVTRDLIWDARVYFL